MNDFDSIITVTHVGPEDYTGEDGLLYCGKCRTPKQFRMDAAPLEGRLLPCPCRCEQERIDRETTEQEITVHMTNFALILNDLTASFEGRNEYISQLCRALLLIIDDFGMERGTEYGLEQVYNVIDSRYRSRRPLIVTTNIPLQDLQHPQDTAHARIYDRLLEMCAPIRFSGENFRKATAQDKLARLKNLMD